MCAVEIYQVNKGRCDSPRIRSAETVITINRAAVEKYFKGVEYFRIGYDAASFEIVILPAGSPQPNAIKLQGKRGGSKQITTFGFFKAFGLENWKHHDLEIKKTKTEIRLALGIENKPVHAKKKKSVGSEVPPPPHSIPPDIDETQTRPDPPAERATRWTLVDYKCAQCGYSNLAWKYNKSMKQFGGHPAICTRPNCNSKKFVKVE